MRETPNPHESWIKTPKQLLAAVLAGFAVPILVIVLLVTYVGNKDQIGAGSSQDNVAKRIAPVASYELKDPTGPRVYKTGAEIYQQVCVACHASGVAGAPKFADATAWRPHITAGMAHMIMSLLQGKNAMPARAGTNPDDVTDYELERALVHMANAAGGNFPEPAEPVQTPLQPPSPPVAPLPALLTQP